MSRVAATLAVAGVALRTEPEQRGPISRARAGSYFVCLCFLFLLLLAACSSGPAVDPNDAPPGGDPPFPPGNYYGIVDPHHYLDPAAVYSSLSIIDGLQRDGLAEVVVLVQEQVKRPEDYATHYGRYIDLGEKDRNNGLVWLIRPDVPPEDNRITYSVGRGLPRLTSTDLVPVMMQAAPAIDSGAFGDGVLTLVKGTDETIRRIYGKEPK